MDIDTAGIVVVGLAVAAGVVTALLLSSVLADGLAALAGRRLRCLECGRKAQRGADPYYPLCRRHEREYRTWQLGE